MNRNSILLSVKKMLGIEPDYTYFDDDLIFHINSVFSILTQMGAGPKEGYMISGVSESWTDFMPDTGKIQFVKTYLNLKVKMIFDPPTNSTILSAYERQIAELEWRISTTFDPGDYLNE